MEAAVSGSSARDRTLRRSRDPAAVGEVWRWPVRTCPIVVLILRSPEPKEDERHHDVLVLDLDETALDGPKPGQVGANWKISACAGWERVS
jgi:hypothetical protein